MDHVDFIVCSFMENSIGLKMVKQISRVHVRAMARLSKQRLLLYNSRSNIVLHIKELRLKEFQYES